MDSPWASKYSASLKAVLAVFVLAGLVVFLYFPALSGPFLLDDVHNIAPARLQELSFQELHRVLTGNTSGFLGRSVAVLTFSIDHVIGGGDPFNFKVTNLVVHLCNGILVFLFCSLLLSITSKDQAKRTTQQISLLIALIWLVHPLQVSSVMYVVQRMTLLSTFFVLLALLSYLSVRTSYSPSPRKILFGYLITLVAVVLACLSKENGVLVILYILLLEWLIISRSSRGPGSMLLMRGFTIAVCLFLIAIGLWVFYQNLDWFMRGYVIRDFDLTERLMTQTAVMVFYLQQMVWPDIASMSLYHDDFQIVRLWTLEAVGSSLLLLCLVAVVFVGSRKFKLIAFGIGLFFASHLLESTVFPLELVFEHRNYFGLVGVVLAVISLLSIVTQRVSQQGRILIACTYLAVIGFQTHSRAVEWSDLLVHDGIAAQQRPGSLRALSAYTVALAKSGRVDDAILVLNQNNDDRINKAWHALQNVALKGIKDEVTQIDVERSISYLEIADINTEVAITLSQIYQNQRDGRFTLPDDAGMERMIEMTLARKSFLVFDKDLAKLHAFYSELMGKKGDFTSAMNALDKAAELAPTDLELRLRQAWLEWHHGEKKEALRQIDFLNAEAGELNSFQRGRLERLLIKSNQSKRNRASDSMQTADSDDSVEKN